MPKTKSRRRNVRNDPMIPITSVDLCRGWLCAHQIEADAYPLLIHNTGIPKLCARGKRVWFFLRQGQILGIFHELETARHIRDRLMQAPPVHWNEYIWARAAPDAAEHVELGLDRVHEFTRLVLLDKRKTENLVLSLIQALEKALPLADELAAQGTTLQILIELQRFCAAHALDFGTLHAHAEELYRAERRTNCVQPVQLLAPRSAPVYVSNDAWKDVSSAHDGSVLEAHIRFTATPAAAASKTAEDDNAASAESSAAPLTRYASVIVRDREYQLAFPPPEAIPGAAAHEPHSALSEEPAPELPEQFTMFEECRF